MLTPIDCQAVRAELQWTRDKLANEAGIAVEGVIAFELGLAPSQPELIAALTGALEAGQMTRRA